MHCRVSALLSLYLFLPLGLDPGELKLLAQNLRKLFQRDVNFQQMLPWNITRFPARLVAIHGDGRSGLPISLSHSPLAPWRKTKRWDINLRDRNADEVLPFASNQLLMGKV